MEGLAEPTPHSVVPDLPTSVCATVGVQCVGGFLPVSSVSRACAKDKLNSGRDAFTFGDFVTFYSFDTMFSVK